MSIKSLVKNTLIAVQNRKYAKALEAHRMSYARWQDEQSLSQEDASFSMENYVIFRSAQGTPATDYVRVLQAYLSSHPDALLVYGDEDVEVSPGVYENPYFKPDWSPDLLEQWFYLGGLLVVHRSLIKQVTEQAYPGEVIVEAAEQLSFEQLIGKAVQLAGGYRKRQLEAIGHVQRVLFHRSNPWPDLRLLQEKDVQASEGHLLSIVIPSKDHPRLLDTCLGAIKRLETELSYEIIVVDNGSNDTNRHECQKIFGQYEAEGMRITYLYEPMEFDFSRMCNLGAQSACGDLLLFLNDDVELACANTLAAMAYRGLMPHTGAVGLKLYYPGGKRMQHCGITNLPMGPVHKLQFLEDDRDYYFGSNSCNRNVLAVTAACLMIETRKYREAGGFPEQLKVAFNDVSLCFRLHELGYYNLVWNRQYAYHHESLSRGDDEADHKLRRLLRERKMLYQLHPTLEDKDPYYPKQLGRDGLDTRIRPAYETGRNKPQIVSLTGDCPELSGYRRDDCLMLRVEMSNSRELLGYSVVLGDNNACYEKTLLLCNVDGIFSEQQVDLPGLALQGSLKSYLVPIEGQYRPDLVENLPDQKNVGLCGFWLQVPGTGEQECRIPAGTYRIGILARNRVTGTKLIQFTNREWKIEY